MGVALIAERLKKGWWLFRLEDKVATSHDRGNTGIGLSVPTTSASMKGYAAQIAGVKIRQNVFGYFELLVEVVMKDHLQVCQNGLLFQQRLNAYRSLY